MAGVPDRISPDDTASAGGAASIVLADSSDVIDSLGRPGLLTTRTGEPVATVVVPAVRSDVLVQRLDGLPGGLPDDAPAAVASWLDEAAPAALRGAAVVVVSLLAELSDAVFRHVETGILIQAPEGPLDPGVEEWLDRRCRPVGPIDEQATAANLAQAVEQLGEGTRLVVYNLSTFAPDGDDIEAAIAFGDRAQRLDLALAHVAGDHPVVVVDADRIVAERGAGDHVVGAGRYSVEAAGDIAEEAVGQIDALRVLDPMTSELALLLIPRYDRRTIDGSITRWHKQVGDEVAPGDVLFDIEFGGLASHLGATKDFKMQTRVMTLGVVAGEPGHLLEVSPTTQVSVGSPVAVVGARPELDPGDINELTPHFRVGLRVVER
jgi:hypothetical protein